jgi:L-rhamnonate dehydratase
MRSVKITAVRLREVVGLMEHDGEFWEERLIRPIDVYPEHRAEGPGGWLPTRIDANHSRITTVLVEIDTDEGITGLGGPVPHDVAFSIAYNFRNLILGDDALATEKLWDKMYRHAVHGRKGVEMLAISAIDCVLWDIRGKYYNAPVHRLLGGPIRETIPAYASALGFSLELEKVAQRAKSFVDQGFRSTKWFPRYGPTDGRDGMEKNEALAQTLREAIGPDNDFMLDAWMSWSVPYTVAMAERLEQYRPRWIEEPVMPDLMAEGCAEIRSRINVPIATGEHEYTRWGIKLLLDAGSAEVLQPDTYWAGGITEMIKICALASCYGVPVIPHGHSVHANIQLSAALPIPSVPLVEFLIKWQTMLQFFWKERLWPVNGDVTVPTSPGMGMEVDPAKIESERELTWA